ncbi:hypothetical protein ACWDYJ_15915 [Streptomyces sp. NPDC003042]
MLVAGSLLAPGVLCIALGVPMADAVVHGVRAAERQPPAACPPFAAILFTSSRRLPGCRSAC